MMEEKKLKNLKIKTRLKISSFLKGHHSSIFKDEGIDFYNIRKYSEGDSYRDIDWKSTAKFGGHNPNFPFFIREYTGEKNLRVYLAVDFSGSMFFGSKIKKIDLVVSLVKDLIYSLNQSRDSVGLFFFTDKIELSIKAQNNKGHIVKILNQIKTFHPEGRESKIEISLDSVFLRVKRKSVLFIISDFQDYKSTLNSLRRLRNKHDVIVVHIFDPSEYNISNMGLVQFEDFETGELALIDTSDSALRDKYHETMVKKNKIFNEELKKINIDVIQLSTTENYAPPIINFFRNRVKRFKYA